MFVYYVLFWLGAVGFAAMVAMGFMHGGHHHGDGHGHGHLGHANGHGLDHGHGHGHAPLLDHGIGHGHADVGGHDHSNHGPLTAPGKLGSAHAMARLSRFGKFKSIFAISPIDIFSMALGAGAAALLARHSVSAEFLPWVAAAGAIVMNYGLVRPMFMLAMKFVGVPSEGLEGAIARIGEAITRFDANGRGLVHLVLDGEDKQLLANLDDTDREMGVQVAKGDKLLVLDVDAVKNTCRVTRV